MSVAIYYTVKRSQTLTTAEQQSIHAILAKYSMRNELEAYLFRNEGDFNGENFHIADQADLEPGAVLAGSTVLPDRNQDIFWSTIQRWCKLLTEIRELLPDGDWHVHIDDHDVVWDAQANEFDPTK